jgi:hypothetical protein
VVTTLCLQSELVVKILCLESELVVMILCLESVCLELELAVLYWEFHSVSNSGIHSVKHLGTDWEIGLGTR